MNLNDLIKKSFIALTTVFAIGCSSTDKKPSYPTWMAPVNAVGAAYFGALATHEGTHALAAKLSGGKNIRVDILPQAQPNGVNFGATKCDGNITANEQMFISVAAPYANFSVEIATKELLKTGRVPKHFQPTLAWYSLGNKIAIYYQAGLGLARFPTADLGKQPVGFAIGLLAGQIAYDVYDYGFRDNKSLIDVLLGNDFYEQPDKKLSVHIGQIDDGFGVFAKLTF